MAALASTAVTLFALAKQVAKLRIGGVTCYAGSENARPPPTRCEISARRVSLLEWCRTNAWSAEAMGGPEALMVVGQVAKAVGRSYGDVVRVDRLSGH